jgi:cell wall-associated NlpC family hydrolase
VSEREAVALAEALAEVRAHALASFGWTHLEVGLEMELGVGLAAEPGALKLVGSVAAPRAIARLRAAITTRLPGAVIDTRAIEILRTDSFVALPAGVTALWRRPDRELPAELATELVAGDGPVELLVGQGGASLVRVPDGTLGWTRQTLGPACAPHRLAAARPLAPAQLAEHARGWIDAPYRLGGTQPAGIDCSALVQRLLATIGALVPRHSADQLAIDPRAGEGRGEAGDIVASWSNDEAPCHVGLAIGGGRIVHASRSRARVVIETVEQWQGRAARLAHVPLAATAELQRRAAGHRGLVDVLALGRDD